MKNFYPLSFAKTSLQLVFALLLSANHLFAGIGDTTIVQTLRFDNNLRAGVFMFPDDSTKTYEKIIMLYSMRCKNGLISNQTYRDQGCGEWDYNCYTYIVDSLQTDSIQSVQGSYKISNFSDSVFNYTTIPVWAYTQYNQQEITYTSVISEVAATVGNGTTALNEPFNTANTVSRTQYLWTSAELTTGGLTGGNITGLKADILSFADGMNNLRIRIKHTTQTALDENNPETSGFTEVYFLNTQLSSSGLHSFNFHTPFNWDGTSNIIVDFSYANSGTGINNTVQGHDAGFNAGLLSFQPDAYLSCNGTLSYLQVNASALPAITDQITLAFWVYGDPAKLPADVTILEGNDNNGKRQVNIHLPWSDSKIYWDCGNDGTGYDRISKAATTSEFEGKWNFWTFTKNATTGDMKIYLNGALWLSGTGKTKMISLENMVAGMGLNANNIYQGAYDELSIWNKELSPASVLTIMNRDISNAHPDYANLLAYYKLNEGSANLAFDSSPNGFDADIINPGWHLHRGNTLFRNFNNTTFRPNITFVSGIYTTIVSHTTVLDSVMLNANAVISYSIVNTNELATIDTIYVWPSGYAYIYDTAGVKIDSIVIANQNTITIVPLAYFQKRPMRFELINFITPYGIFLNLDGLNGKTWEFDVTDFAPVLKGARFLAMEDGKYQEDNDIKFVFYEGTPPRDVKSISQIWPNASWVSPSYADIFKNKYFEPRDILLSANAAQFKIRSAISGHQQNGEFDPHNHTITLNNSVNFTRLLTKECATNPIYPQGGTWVYDRQGWCPGAAVDMKEYDITGNVSPGATITLDYSIPVAVAGSSNYRINNQLVSYGTPNFSLDAAIDYIKTPSKRTEFLRISPICNAPIIAIKNTGSTVLTDLDITYGRVGGTMSNYHWTGNLNFLASAEITLPAPNWLGTNIDEFIAVVKNPNGGNDQYAANDTLISAFNIPPAYPANLKFELRTNHYGSHTAYTVKNSTGNIMISRSGLASDSTYTDIVNLATGCYTILLTDQGDDGLSWWANTAQGTGYFRIRNATTNTIIKTFDPDFGDNIYQQFTVDYSLPVEEPVAESIQNLNIYPNPAGDFFTATFSLPLQSTAQIKLVNMLGEILLTETIKVSNSFERISLDVRTIESGLYYVVVETGSIRKIQKLVIAR